MKLILKRHFFNEKKTLGDLFIFLNGKLLGMIKTIELPWRDNMRRISCIPSGEYIVVPHISPKFGWSLWLKDVPDRSAILIHIGNFVDDTLGCILVGVLHDDINNNGVKDVKHSGVAMEILRHYIEKHNPSEITINVKYDRQDTGTI